MDIQLKQKVMRFKAARAKLNKLQAQLDSCKEQLNNQETELIEYMQENEVSEVKGKTFYIKISRDIGVNMPTTLQSIKDPAMQERLEKCVKVLMDFDCVGILKTNMVINIPTEKKEELDPLIKQITQLAQSENLGASVRSDANYQTLKKAIKELLESDLKKSQKEKIISTFDVEQKNKVAYKEL